jgi:hypothetical protein
MYILINFMNYKINKILITIILIITGLKSEIKKKQIF